MINLLVIEDNTLRAIMADPRVTALVPCLADAKRYLETAPKKCGSCQRKKAGVIHHGLQRARNCLTGLPPALKVQLKAVLNAKQIRVRKKDAAGKVFMVTF